MHSKVPRKLPPQRPRTFSLQGSFRPTFPFLIFLSRSRFRRWRSSQVLFRRQSLRRYPFQQAGRCHPHAQCRFQRPAGIESAECRPGTETETISEATAEERKGSVRQTNTAQKAKWPDRCAAGFVGSVEGDLAGIA